MGEHLVIAVMVGTRLSSWSSMVLAHFRAPFEEKLS